MAQKGHVPRKQAHSTLGDSAFPKITGKRDVFLRALETLILEEGLVGQISMEGTVKLHGMHADIVFDILPGEADRSSAAVNEHVPQGKIRFQSRNREVLPTESQNGWPKNVAYHVKELFELKSQVLARFQQRNPHLIVDTDYPLIIGGEWVGQKVQRDVGICQLTQRFIILAININGQWQNDADFADIENSEANIYNVFRVPQYKMKFDLRMLKDDNPAFNEMQQLANEVEKCCPFAAAFGVPDSQGEGIVWKIGTPLGRAQANYWLKTKGPIAAGIQPQPRLNSCTGETVVHGSRKTIPKARTISTGQQKVTPTDLLAKRLVTDRRVEQGFEYLQEMCIDATSIDNWRSLADWLVDDVLEEEKAELEELNEKYRNVPGFQFDIELRKSITRIGRERFIEEMAKRKAAAAREECEQRLNNQRLEQMRNRCREQSKEDFSNTRNRMELSDDSQKWMQQISGKAGAHADKVDDTEYDRGVCGHTTTKASPEASEGRLAADINAAMVST